MIHTINHYGKTYDVEVIAEGDSWIRAKFSDGKIRTVMKEPPQFSISLRSPNPAPRYRASGRFYR